MLVVIKSQLLMRRVTMTDQLSIVQYVSNENVQKNIQEVLRERTPQFITSMVSLVNSNASLKACDKQSVMAACLVAASLNLPINPSLGLAYIIPYGNIAQFQIGWKGLVDLAIRTKRYKHINVVDVREGELGKKDMLKGTIQFHWIEDEEERNKAKVIGYVSYFELMEGFEKILYMTVDQLEKHAKKYSQSYRKNSPNMNQWRDDFDSMAKKTVLKLLINRFGPKNAELERALEADQAAIDERGTKYIDNPPVNPIEEAEQKEHDRIKAFIENAKTLGELQLCSESVEDPNSVNSDLLDLYNEKKKELSKK